LLVLAKGQQEEDHQGDGRGTVLKKTLEDRPVHPVL